MCGSLFSLNYTQYIWDFQKKFPPQRNSHGVDFPPPHGMSRGGGIFFRGGGIPPPYGGGNLCHR